MHTKKKIPKQTFCLINKIREVNCVDPLPENIHEYIARDGYQALADCLLKYSRKEVIDKIKKSGLRDALNVLEKVEGIKLFYFDKSDVIRHPLVAKIVEAYEAERRKEESGI